MISHKLWLPCKTWLSCDAWVLYIYIYNCDRVTVGHRGNHGYNDYIVIADFTFILLLL